MAENRDLQERLRQNDSERAALQTELEILRQRLETTETQLKQRISELEALLRDSRFNAGTTWTWEGGERTLVGVYFVSQRRRVGDALLALWDGKVQAYQPTWPWLLGRQYHYLGAVTGRIMLPFVPQAGAGPYLPDICPTG